MLLGLSLLCFLFLFPSAILSVGSKARLFLLNWLWLAELGLFMLEFALFFSQLLLMFPKTEFIIRHLARIRRNFALWLSSCWFSWGFWLSLRDFLRLLERMSLLLWGMFCLRFLESVLRLRVDRLFRLLEFGLCGLSWSQFTH